MRILFLEQQSWRAGAERVLEEVLHSLGREFTPIVAFPEDGPFAADVRRRGVETLWFPLGHYRSGAKSLADMMAFPLRSLDSALRLARVIRERDVEIVYINSPRCLVAGALAARLTGRPSLFHLHMTLTRRLDFWVTEWAARYVTEIVACSNTAARSLHRNRPEWARLIKVIHNPVRKPAASSMLPSEGRRLASSLGASTLPVIGVVGRLNPAKGQHVLLEAAAILARSGREIQIVFVGAAERGSKEDRAYVRALQDLTRELGLAVSWAGYQDDPNPFYAILNALVIPSTVSEGLPLVALEALQWGVPVLGSDVGGIPEVVHDGVNGFLTPPADPRALASGLERLLTSPELRAELQAGARSSIDERFSVETFRRSIREVVFQLGNLRHQECVKMVGADEVGARLR